MDLERKCEEEGGIVVWGGKDGGVRSGLGVCSRYA